MAKQAAVPTQGTNYPNVLGAISHSVLLNLHMVQTAIACRPPVIAAGRSIDVLIMLQNASAGDLDAVVRLVPPQKDLAGKAGRFMLPVNKPVRVGLSAGEVGMVTLPLLVGHQAQPGTGYFIEVEIQTEQKKRADRVRDTQGGVRFDLNDMEDDERKTTLSLLYTLSFSAQVSGAPPGPTTTRAILRAPFAIEKAAIAQLPQEMRPGYTRLWTEADNPDPNAVVEKAKGAIAPLLQRLNRGFAFFPLLRKTQELFTAADYRLWAGEAVAIAKLMCLVIETTAAGKPPTPATGVYPQWYVRLSRIATGQNAPKTPAQLEQALVDGLYFDLLADAAAMGYSMLATLTRMNLGTPGEQSTRTEALVEALRHANPSLTMDSVYVPFVLAGLVACSRITLPQEDLIETLNLLERATHKRADERNPRTAAIFDIVNDLIERATQFQ